MIRLTNSLSYWGNDNFDQAFLQETAALTLDQLPLQQAMALGNAVVDENRSMMINSKHADDSHITVRTGVFFSSIIAGCSCADDPTPIDLNSEYCELAFIIDRSSGDTRIEISA